MFDLFNKVPHLSSSLCSWSGEELSDCDIGPKKKKRHKVKLRIMYVNILDVLLCCEARNITGRGRKQDGTVTVM